MTRMLIKVSAGHSQSKTGHGVGSGEGGVGGGGQMKTAGWLGSRQHRGIKLQTLVYHILPSRKVPESGARSVARSVR